MSYVVTNSINGPLNFLLLNLNLVYELVYVFLTFNSVHSLVYDWYMLGIQRMTKKKDCDWKCLTRFYIIWYLCSIQKQNWYMNHEKAFLLYHCYVQYLRLQEMTIFDWCTLLIWISGICMATCFSCCDLAPLYILLNHQQVYMVVCWDANGLDCAYNFSFTMEYLWHKEHFFNFHCYFWLTKSHNNE